MWEAAEQGLGMAMSTVVSEKNRKMLFIGNVFYCDISACCFTSVSRAWPPENCKYLSPARSHTLAMEKISSPGERWKWSLGLGQHLKGASPNMRTESH